LRFELARTLTRGEPSHATGYDQPDVAGVRFE